jgi:hypothetical protein
LAVVDPPVDPAVQGPRPEAEAPGNDTFPWDDFDPDLYLKTNYLQLRDDDRQILRLVRNHFDRTVDPRRPLARGIDVGSGPNLYPALTMLPFCDEITMWERGQANVKWLNSEIWQYSPLWEPYWNTLARRDSYGRLDHPRDVLRAKADVQRANLFQLPTRRWDVGTMFFVAESISWQRREFRLATRKFVQSLKPGAPFAAAFMRNSPGYNVGSLRFPAVMVEEADVKECLSTLVDDVEVTTVRSRQYLRPGYDGMIIALGRAARNRR